jgi:hypothetical protein
MWFGKWFNRHRDEEDDEPARFSAPQLVKPPQPDLAQTRGANAASASPKSSKTSKGFDPYNSGAFERRNAWERIPRR